MEKTNDGQSPAESSQNEEEKVAEKKSVRPLPKETWLQVYAWIARMELAKRVSLVDRRFSEIAHMRLHQRSMADPNDNLRRMRKLLIVYKLVGQNDAEGQRYEAVIGAMVNGKYKRIKWPNCPMPENIVGMERITVKFFDEKVLAFFDRIRPLLAKELHLYSWPTHPGHSGNFLAMENILPLCTGPVLSITLDIEQIDKFKYAKFPSKFPQHWAKCQLLDVHKCFYRNEIGMPKLVEWLTERRDDGQPKLMKILSSDEFRDDLIGLLKQHFLASTHQQVSFLVRLPLRLGEAIEFCEINGRTNEQLSLARIDPFWALLTRCPIGADQQQDGEMVKGREKLLKRKSQVLKCLNSLKEGVLRFDVAKIGDFDVNEHRLRRTAARWTSTKKNE